MSVRLVPSHPAKIMFVAQQRRRSAAHAWDLHDFTRERSQTCRNIDSMHDFPGFAVAMWSRHTEVVQKEMAGESTGQLPPKHHSLSRSEEAL
jgi:hypothetical protein